MLKLFKNKKAQSTAEYAIMIALVIGAVVAMQTFVRRGINARIFDAVIYLANSGMNSQATDLRMGTTAQYEPDYLSSEYTTTRTEDMTFSMDNASTRQSGYTNVERGGSQNITGVGRQSIDDLMRTGN